MTVDDTTDTEAARPPALKLIPVIPDGGIAGPSVSMKWCISDETISRLAELGALRPYLLVVVTNGPHEMSRQLFPLRQGKRYVRFFVPGTNVVHATIVWREDGANPGEKIFRRDDSGRYRMDVLAPRRPERFYELGRQLDELWDRVRVTSGRDEKARLREEVSSLQHERDGFYDQDYPPGLRREFDSIRRFDEEDVVELEVDAAHFASEKNNLWPTRRLAGVFPWDSRPVDPCQVRQRALFALASLPLLAMLLVGLGLPILVLVAVFNVLAAGFFLLLGARGIGFGPVLKPWSTPSIEIWGGTTSSVWFSKMVERTGPLGYPYPVKVSRSFLVKAFNPPTLMLWVGAFFVLRYGVGQTAGYVEGVAFLAYVLVMGAAGSYLLATTTQRQERRAKARQIEVEARQRRTERLVHELDAVSCAAVAQGRMPRPSFALRFEGAKAAICQPFAKRPS